MLVKPGIRGDRMTTGQQVQSSLGPFKDRSIALIAFGMMQIALGIFLALSAVFTSFALIARRALHSLPTSPLTTRMLLFLPILSAFGSAWFITNGIGSMRARRWARALIFAGSWIGLLLGSSTAAGMVTVMPALYRHFVVDGPTLSEIVLVSKRLLMVIVPGAFALFYGSRNVKATCERIDPQTRWTDECPLSVLVLSMMFAFKGLQMLAILLMGFPQALFGRIVSGLPGTVILMASASAYGLVSLGIYKVRREAWWFGFALALILLASAWITFLSGVSLSDYYAGIELSSRQKELIAGSIQWESSTWVVSEVLVSATYLGCFLYTRKYFTNRLGPLDSDQPDNSD